MAGMCRQVRLFRCACEGASFDSEEECGMIVQDKVGNEWKLSSDERWVYFHVQSNPAPEPVVAVEISRLAGYFALDGKERERFRQELGRMIGLPLWPLFAEMFFDAEIDHLRKAGAFGVDDDVEPEEALLVPRGREESLRMRPGLAPESEELEAHSRERRLYREWLRSQGVCAVCVQTGELVEESAREQMEQAGSKITCCVVCLCPASHVGVYGTEIEGLILHGICRACLPRDEESVDERRRCIEEAIDEQRRMGIPILSPKEGSQD
jgi:hypothetical protein